jgi:hypothetical protein
MKYKTEIVINNSVVFAPITQANTPKNAVRLAIYQYLLNRTGKPDYMTVFTMNEEGQIWKYSAERKPTGQYYLIPESNIPSVMGRNVVIDAFAGNTPIAKMRLK